MTKKNIVRRFIKDTRGANMVEYMMLVGLVALLSIAAFRAFGKSVQGKISEQGASVTNDIKLAARLSCPGALPSAGLLRQRGSA